MAPTTDLRKILIVGAGGKNIGHHVAKVLAADPYFTVSILSRKASKSKYPANTTLIPIEDSMTHDQLVEAFRGQDAIVSGMGFDGKATEKRMIDAVIEAGVKRFVPSEYGINNRDERARNLAPVFALKGETQDYLVSNEGSGLTWTAVATGLWLDWALDPAFPFLNIDIKSHKATYWENGTYTFTFTTLPTAADAVRKVLLHPSETANKLVPVRNFEVSPRDIVAQLEKIQAVRYQISNIGHRNEVIKPAKEKWEAKQDVMAAVELIKAGFMLEGYGSNFLEDSKVPVANDVIGFDAASVSFEQVVQDAVETYGS